MPMVTNMVKTSLTKASRKTKSLKTTVPNNVVSQFDLTSSDKLNWLLVAESGQVGVKVIPIKCVAEKGAEKL